MRHRVPLQLEQRVQVVLAQLGPMRDGPEAHLSGQFGQHSDHEQRCQGTAPPTPLASIRHRL